MGCEDYEYESGCGCLSFKVHMGEEGKFDSKSGGDGISETRSESISNSSCLPFLGSADVIRYRSNLARATLAEGIGTFLLVFIGCGSCVGGDTDKAGVMIDEQAVVVRIALAFGLTVTCLAVALGPTSGANLNPAVTLGLVLGRKLGMLRGLLYLCAQCLGSTAGAGTLSLLLSEKVRGSQGVGKTALAVGVNPGQAVGVELLITTLLVLVVFVATNEQLNNDKFPAPLAIGLSISVCHLFAIPLTGSSMNPARSLGPAIIVGDFKDHWVYWVGPLSGSILGVVIFKLLLSPRRNRPRRKLKPLLTEESPPYMKKEPEKEPEGEDREQGYQVLCTQEQGDRQYVWIDKS